MTSRGVGDVSLELGRSMPNMATSSYAAPKGSGDLQRLVDVWVDGRILNRAGVGISTLLLSEEKNGV